MRQTARTMFWIFIAIAIVGVLFAVVRWEGSGANGKRRSRSSGDGAWGVPFFDGGSSSGSDSGADGGSDGGGGGGSDGGGGGCGGGGCGGGGS